MFHKISNRDIVNNSLDPLFMFDGKMEKADIMYSDPPWGLGNLKYWRTMNGQNGHDVAWMEFLEQLRYLRDRHVAGGTYIETGLRYEKDLEKVFGAPSAVYQIVYSSKKFLNLLMCWGELPQKDPTGMSGMSVVNTVLQSLPHKPRSVFDPCVGLGNTAKGCKNIGAVCFANELNRKRMLRTAQILPFKEV